MEITVTNDWVTRLKIDWEIKIKLRLSLNVLNYKLFHKIIFND